MKRTVRICCIVLCILLVAGGIGIWMLGKPKSTRYFEGAALKYYDALCAQGFPEDYAEELTELHLLHPSWEFVPLQITDTNEQYTWNFVIDAETEEADTNLIAPTNAYEDYRHKTNRKTYDSGYYQASRDAVEYFMDPRNFINETDIFQFFDLGAPSAPSLSSVEAVLRGTFMENKVLENGKTYAQNFVDIGQAVGINPVYLAVKVFQEQGAEGSSPLVTGDVGDVLWHFYQSRIEKTAEGAEVVLPLFASRGELMQLNGYYNLMNVGASGKGVFAIYRNAAAYAQKGSEEMQTAWGGDPSWNTVWKSLWGGALLLKSDYIDRYQSTVYLQKFNVDGRSGRNFWGQYMQNVAGALIEARSLYQSLAGVGALDAPATFLIPVYRDMPRHASADPANGECSYLRSTDQKFGYGIALRNPVSEQSDGVPLYRTVEVARNESMQINGLLSHDYGVRSIEYSLDGGAWVHVDSDAGRFDFEISSAFLQSESHILIIRGIADFDAENAEKKSNSHFLGAVLYLNVTGNAA